MIIRKISGLIITLTMISITTVINKPLNAKYISNIAQKTNSNEQLNKLKLVTLGIPPFRQDAPNNIVPEPSPVSLTLLSSNSNQITDTKEWFTKNNLSLSTYTVPNPNLQETGNLVAHIPPNYQDNILVKAIQTQEREFLIYGSNYGDGKYLLVYNLQAQEFTHGYDFSNYTFSPNYVESDLDFIEQSLNWVAQQSNILYLSHSHQTYAESSYGMNGYLTAIDTNTNQILWRSQPLVCNSNNFVIIDSVIICGYGFTAEPDFLYLINKNTGKVIQQIRVKTAPEYIIQQEDKLYVRTYDTDYVFAIEKN